MNVCKKDAVINQGPMRSLFEQLKQPYLIGEIGINHNGDLGIAKKLIDAVNACSWNCAKFQKRNPDKAVPEHQKNAPRDTPWGHMTYLEYKRRVELSRSDYNEIDRYCREKPLDWTASVWDLDSLQFLLRYDVPFLKIPSAKLTDDELLWEAASSGKPLVVSTGMSELKEVDHAINLILAKGVRPVVMHTNSSYPTPRAELNLAVIPILKERYGCVVGYSGHESDLEPTIVAVALGARVIERHITLSRDMWGTDQNWSLEVLAMDTLRKRCAEIDVILGASSKQVTPSEIESRGKLRG
jgi:N-acetylneuraminate synthase